jgi:thiamine pyrophosphate-dependent acetolactate synthase large subunit-like protein
VSLQVCNTGPIRWPAPAGRLLVDEDGNCKILRPTYKLQSARYDLVMRAFGGEGETIERLVEVAPAVRRAFAAGVPYCLNVKIRGVRSPFTDWQIAGKKR